mgnify:CR=1 FL=1
MQPVNGVSLQNSLASLVSQTEAPFFVPPIWRPARSPLFLAALHRVKRLASVLPVKGETSRLSRVLLIYWIHCTTDFSFCIISKEVNIFLFILTLFLLLLSSFLASFSGLDRSGSDSRHFPDSPSSLLLLCDAVRVRCVGFLRQSAICFTPPIVHTFLLLLLLLLLL